MYVRSANCLDHRNSRRLLQVRSRQRILGAVGRLDRPGWDIASAVVSPGPYFSGLPAARWIRSYDLETGGDETRAIEYVQRMAVVYVCGYLSYN